MTDSRYTVTTGADERHYDDFGHALGTLALHAESGRRAAIYAPGRLLLAHTRGDRTITIAGAESDR